MGILNFVQNAHSFISPLTSLKGGQSENSVVSNKPMHTVLLI